jgi:type IV secretory pathway VirB4 component
MAGARRGLMLFDEAWLALQAMPGDINSLLRDARKMELTVVLMTHVLQDLENQAMADAIQATCPNFFMGGNWSADATGTAARRLRDWNFEDQERKLIAEAARLGPGNFYFRCSAGSGLISLDLGPLARAFCASGGTDADEEAIHRILNRYGRPDFDIHWLLHKAAQCEWTDDRSAAVLRQHAAILKRQRTTSVPQAAE